MSRRCPAAAVLSAVLALGWWQPAAARGQPTSSPFAKCERAGGAAWTYEELLCFSRVGRQHHLFAEARRRLRRLGAGTIERPWATLVLAHATFEEYPTEGIALYELAAEGFVRSGEAAGEVVARQNLRNMYRQRGSRDAAREQVERAVAAAEASKQPLTIARASVIQAGEIMETGGDIGGAYRTLRRAERLAFPGGPIGLRRSILIGLGNAALYLGRLDEAIEALERHRVLRAEDGSTVDAALVAFNLLNARLTVSEARPVAGARDLLIADAGRVLEEAAGLQQTAVEAQTRRILGELIRTRDPGLAASHLQRCLDLEATLGHPQIRAACLWSLALNEAGQDAPRADRADRLSREALALVGANRGGPLLAYAWQSRLRLVWRTLPEDQAIAESLEALDAIERLRAGQRDEGSRATLFSTWAREYYWLAGRLLTASSPRLPQAFAIGERLRSRVLLEYLADAGVSRRTVPDKAAARQELVARISAAQRALLSSSLSGEQRRSLLDQLQLLELERDDQDEGRLAVVTADAVPFASLEAIQQALDATEALVWFSIAPWKDLYDDFGGGAWAIVVTRQGPSIHRLEVGADLDSQVAALVGLLRDRQSAPAVWTPAVRRLGTTLLGPAVAGLPPGVTRLAIVSDGVLHRVPFEALSVDSASTPLGDRFDVSVVPSATLWLRLRQSRNARGSGRALVLADPELSRGRPDGNGRLDPLPWARQEAHAIGRLLDLGVDDVLEGSAASERALKHTALARVGVLHLAAHARADTAFPERSAVYLTPGDEGEDGWLQPREIADLDLHGGLVVLSACESADGALLSGEGALSLARAFFAGGANAVVATRWPLRDDDAAFVMERFYRSLREGEDVAAALRHARRDAVAAGLPAAAWAGVALLGNGTHRPFDARTPAGRRWRLIVFLAIAIGLGAAGMLTIGRRRRPA